MVMDVQAPSAAMSRSYGPGPLSEPPTANGSSAISRWGPIVISCANPAALPCTVASLDAASLILRSPSVGPHSGASHCSRPRDPWELRRLRIPHRRPNRETSRESRCSAGDRPVLPEPSEKRPAAHAEAPRRLRLVPADGRHRPGDHLTLERLDVLAKVPLVVRRRLGLD